MISQQFRINIKDNIIKQNNSLLFQINIFAIEDYRVIHGFLRSHMINNYIKSSFHKSFNESDKYILHPINEMQSLNPIHNRIYSKIT